MSKYRGEFHLICLVLIISVYCSPGAMGKTINPNSPLDDATQVQLQKAQRYAKSGKIDKATPLFLSALESCDDIPKCLGVAQLTEGVGYPMLEVRRQCLSKALSMCTTSEDFLHLAIRARQYECYEITRSAVDNLISNAKTVDELFDLAKKAHEVSLNDIGHLAMERALSQTRTVPDALYFCKQARLMGMQDLLRKTMKDLIDDEQSSPALMALLQQFEPYEIKDLNRYLMKKALDQSTTVEDYYAIWQAARRHRESDIGEVALYRGKKKQIINKIQGDQAALQKQIEAYRQGQAQAGQAPGQAPGQAQQPAPTAPVDPASKTGF